MSIVDNSNKAVIGTVFVDVLKRLSPSDTTAVTSHPIEDGSFISEHTTDMPSEVVMDCVFLNDQLPIPVGGSVADVVGGMTTAADKRDAIKKLKKEKQLVTIETLRDHYENMLLIDIIEDVTPANSSVFEATLIFEHVRLSTLASTSVSLDRIKKKPQAKQDPALAATPTADMGKQAGTAAGDLSDGMESDASLAAKLAAALGL